MAYNEKDLRSKAEAYLAAEQNDVFKAEVEAELAAQGWEALFDRFYTSFAFGTAGMRGIIGGGTNRMNSYMVSKVTQGLADYLNTVSENPSVVISYDSRNYSDLFAMQAALVLAANGVSVFLYSTLHPVPMLSFAVRYLQTTAGIVIICGQGGHSQRHQHCQNQQQNDCSFFHLFFTPFRVISLQGSPVSHFSSPRKNTLTG